MNFLKYLLTILYNYWMRPPWYIAPKVEPNPLEPSPVPEPTPQPKYKWDTKENVRHSIRVICDEEGLSVAEKNLICAVIQAESGFDTKAVNVNSNGTKDLGLIQANTYWYIEKMNLLTEDQALNDPEFCVRLMIKRYREGFLSNWVAYSSGSYKKFL